MNWLVAVTVIWERGARESGGGRRKKKKKVENKNGQGGYRNGNGKGKLQNTKERQGK